MYIIVFYKVRLPSHIIQKEKYLPDFFRFFSFFFQRSRFIIDVRRTHEDERGRGNQAFTARMSSFNIAAMMRETFFKEDVYSIIESSSTKMVSLFFVIRSSNSRVIKAR